MHILCDWASEKAQFDQMFDLYFKSSHFGLGSGESVEIGCSLMPMSMQKQKRFKNDQV